MKLFKKFLIWLAIALGVLVAAFLAVFAYMYFAPGTSVLGFEYVLSKDNTQKTYTESTDLSVSGLQALEIVTDRTDIFICPNAESRELKVERYFDFSGFTKSVNANLSVLETIEKRSFDEKTTAFDKTFRIVVNEPSGWVSKNNSKIVVRVPTEIDINTIYAKSNGGNIYYYSDVEKVDGYLKCSDLYLKTDDSGIINITSLREVANYYLTSGDGNVIFNQEGTVSCTEDMKFYTNRGVLDIDTTLKVRNLYINSNNSKIGPQVNVYNLDGNLNVNAKSGRYKISTIGSVAKPKLVAMNLENAEINFGTVNARVSILADTNDVNNKVYINNLFAAEKENNFNIGSGSLTINKLVGNIAADLSSGNINILEADHLSSVYVYSTSGDINVKYKEYAEDNYNTKLIILTHTGDVDISNISCSSEITVLENSANSRLNLSYCAVANKNGTGLEHFIKAKDRKVNFAVTTNSEAFKCRLLTTTDIKYTGTAFAIKVLESDADYLLNQNEYKDHYKNNYRVGYVLDDLSGPINDYITYGKILIETTNDIYVSEKSN
ncbi:MAG: DUF4097 family beta strand repeat protein [Clostridia bacterium]|nr:DUF4097 family beta strand repeat protein [Clostridia bacterium]